MTTTTTTILDHAAQVLDSATASSSLRRVAATTLLVAIEEGLDVPAETPRLLWRHLQTQDSSFMRVTGLGRALDQALVDEIIAVLLDPLSGDQLKDSASFILATPEAARFIDNNQIDQLVEIAHDSEAVGRVVSIVSARHDVRAFNVDTLARIRDHLQASDDGRIRQHAIAVDKEIPGIETSFIAAMIADEDSEVRIEAANQIDWTHSTLDPGWALETLNDAISRERHPGALTALLEARLRVYEKEGSGEGEGPEDPFIVF